MVQYQPSRGPNEIIQEASPSQCVMFLEVFNIDTDAPSLEVSARNAANNGVVERFHLSTYLEHQPTTDQRVAVLMDVEGAEKDLLDPEIFPFLSESFVIAECHDFIHQGVTNQLLRRFARTHRHFQIQGSGRNPHEVEALEGLPDIQKWSLMSEGRPEKGIWIILIPKEPS